MSNWKKQRRQFDELQKHKKSLARLQKLFLTPRIEDLEQRLAPATLQYSAPLGYDFVAKLKSTGTDVELVDESDSILASMPISEVTDVRITGSNQLSTLTIDETNAIEFPIVFDTADGADTSLYTLSLLGDSISTATYEPTFAADHQGVLNYGVNPVYFGSHVALLAEKLGSFTYATPTGSNQVTIESPNAGQTVINDAQGSDYVIAPVTVAKVGALVINQKDRSDAADVSTVTVAQTGLLAAGLGHLKIETGAGTSTVKFENNDLRLPVAGQGVDVVGGDGATTIIGPNDTNTWMLAGTDAGTLTNTASETDGVQGFVQFSHVAVIQGGSGADTFNVRSSSDFGGTIDGGEGDDTYDVTLSPRTGNLTISDGGTAGSDTLTVTSLGLTDHLVDSGTAITSDYYATVHHTGVETVTLADIADLELRIQTILGEYQSGTRTGDVDLHPGSAELGGFLELSNLTVSFKNISDPLGESANGTVTFTTESATLFPGNALMAEIGHGSLANKHGIYGSYSLSTKTYGIGVTELKLSSSQVEVTVDDAHFSYNPAQPASQTLVHINNVTATLPGLKDTTVTLAGLSFRGDGFSIDNASVVLPNVSLSSVLEVTSPTLSFTNVSYTAAAGSSPAQFTGTLGISATTATLFPGKKFTGTATTVTGTYTFETNIVHVSAGQVDLKSEKFFTASATSVQFSYDTQATGPQTLVTIATIDLTIKPLKDTHVTVDNLAIRTDGFSFDNLVTTLPDMSFGSYLSMTAPKVGFAGVNLTQNELGTTFAGTMVVSADSASLLPGKKFSGTISPSAVGQPAIKGTVNMATGAFSLKAAQLDLTSEKLFTASATDIVLAYDPAVTAAQTLVTIATIDLTLKPLKDTHVSVSHLAIRTDGFSFDNLTTTLPDQSLGSFLTIVTPKLAFTDVNLTVNASGATFAGSMVISTDSASLMPGKKFSGTITPLTAGEPALKGTVNLATGAFSLTAGQLDLTSEKFFTASATNIVLAYDPTVTGTQTLVSIASISLTVKPLKDLGVSVSNLSIRTDGFAFDNLTITPANVSLGTVLTVTNPTISFENIDFTQPADGSAATFRGNLTLAADAASLFPGKQFSGSITPVEAGQYAISGTFNLNSGAFSLTAGKLDLTSQKFFTASATNLVLAYDPTATGSQTIVSLGSLDLTIKPLKDTQVTVSNLAIRTDGFSFDNLVVTLPDMSFGSYLSMTAPTVGYAGVNLTQNELGTTFAGTMVVSADSASLLPGKKFSGTISPSAAGQPAIKGTVNMATGAFSLKAGQLDLTSEKLFTASATDIVLAYDPADTGTQTLVSIASLDLTIKPLKNTNVSVHNLAIRTDGFSFDDLTVTLPDMSFGTYLTIASPSVAFSGVNLTVSGSSVVFAGSLTVSAASASLLPGKKFSGSITPSTEGQPAISGTVNLATGAFSLTAGQVDLGYSGFFTGHATNVIVAFDPVATGPQTIVSIGSMGLKFKPLNDLSIDVTNLAIRTDGFSFDNLSATLGVISIGSSISITSPTVAFAGVNLTIPADGSATTLSGSMTVTAQSARIFPGRKFTASLSPSETMPAIRGTFNFNSLAFSFTTGNFDLNLGGTVQVTGSGFYLAYDPQNTGIQTIAALKNATVKITKVNVEGTLNDFVLTTGGFSLGSVSITKTGTTSIGSSSSPILSVTDLTVAISDFKVDWASGGQVSGTITISANSASVFPNSSTFTATATGISGGFSFNNSGVGNLTITIGTFDLSIGNKLHISASQFLLAPFDDMVASVGSLSATIPALSNLGGTITDLKIWKDGTADVGGFSVGSSAGIANSIGIGKFLPIDITNVGVMFQETDGGRHNLANFDLSVSGKINNRFFSGLPFTPIIKIGKDSLSSPDNVFSFKIRIEDGQVTPIDLGPITIGVENLSIGPVTLAGSITIGGYQNGVFKPEVGGTFEIKSSTVSNKLTVFGSLYDGVLSIQGSNTLSFKIKSLIEVKDAVVNFSLVMKDTGSGFQVTPHIGKIGVGLLKINFSDFMSFQAKNTTIDFDATGSQTLISFGGQQVSTIKADGTFTPSSIKDGGLAAIFGSAAGPLASWGGEVGNFAIKANGDFEILNGFYVKVHIGKMPFGLPDFLPVYLTSAEIKWNDGAIVNGSMVHPEWFSLIVSGGVSKSFPVYGSFSDLKINIQKLIAGDVMNAIEELNGFSIGIDKVNMGPIEMSGELSLGKMLISGSTVWYMRIKGEFFFEGYGGGLDIALSNYGPLICTLSGGGTEPITGIQLQFKNVGLLFGQDPFPDVKDPQELLDSTKFSDPTDITDESIKKVLEKVVAARQYTWDRGFSIVGKCEISDMYIQGSLKGTVSIAINVALGVANPGLKIFMKGTAEIYGFKLAAMAGLFDLTNILKPKFYLAFAMPDPDSPLAFLFPSKTNVSAVLDFTGVATVPIVATAQFFKSVTAGTLAEGQEVFGRVFDKMANDCENDHQSKLSQFILGTRGVYDSGGNPLVSLAEDHQHITTDMFRSRIITLLSGELSDLSDMATFNRDLKLVSALLPKLIIEGTAAFFGDFDKAVQIMVPIFVKAGVDAISAGYEQFNPSLTIHAIVQPTLFGMPIGSPDQLVDLYVNKRGLSFSYTGSLMQMWFGLGVIPKPLASLLTLGVTDTTEFQVTLPFPSEFLMSLIKGTSPLSGDTSFESFVATAVSAVSGWQVYCSTTFEGLGGLFDIGSLTGYLMGPSPKDAKGIYNPSTFFQSKVKNLDPNNTGKPDKAIKDAVAKVSDEIGVPTYNDYQNVLAYGGFLFTGKLYLPNAVMDPVSWVESSLQPVNIWTNVPQFPSTFSIDELQHSDKYMNQILAYLDNIKKWLLQTTEWGELNFFVPGPTAWLVDPLMGYINGFADLKLFGINVGQSKIDMVSRDNPDGTSSPGIQANISIPWMAGFEGQANVYAIKRDPADVLLELIDSPLLVKFVKPAVGDAFTLIENSFKAIKGQNPKIYIPVGMATGGLSTDRMGQWLNKNFGLPSSIFSPDTVSASVNIGFYTPGYDLTADTDSIKRNGGIVFDAKLTIKSVVENAQFHFEIQPFSMLNSTDIATFMIPNFRLRASVDYLGLPNISNLGDILSLQRFLIDIKKDSTGLSMELHGDLHILYKVISADGVFRFDTAGLWGSLRVTTNGDITFGPVTFGGIFTVDINMTKDDKVGYQGVIPAFTAHVLAKGNMSIGDAVTTGSFEFSAGSFGAIIHADAMTKMGPLGSLHVTGDMIATKAGLVAKLYADGDVHLGSLNIEGTTFFGINSTSTTQLGLDPNSFQFYSGGALVITSSFSIKGSFYIKISPGRLSISASGTIDLPVFGTMEVMGGLNLDNYGISGGISVVLSAGGMFGSGFSIKGNAQLLVNTGPIQQSISAFTVDKTTGQVTPSQTIVIPARTLSIDVGGELIVGSVFSIKGEFKMTISNTGFVVVADASIKLFDVSASVCGQIGIYADGMAANIQLSLPSFGVPGLFSISAGAFLQFNSRSHTDEGTGLAANFFSVGLRNCNFTILGFGMSLSEASMTVSNGVWKLNIPSPGLKLDIGPLHFQFYGYLGSDGQFSLTSNYSFGLDLFPIITFGVSGSATLSNTGFYASFTATAGGYYWGPTPWIWPWNWQWHQWSMGTVSASLGIDSSGVSISMFSRSIRLGSSSYSAPSGNWAPQVQNSANPPQPIPQDPPILPLPNVQIVPTTKALQGLPATVEATAISPGRKAPAGKQVSYNWKVKDSEDNTVTYGTGTALAETPFDFSFVPPAPGDYSVIVTAISPQYIRKTEQTYLLHVESVLNSFNVAQTGTNVYGSPATVTVSGPTNADAGLTYSYDFNDDGDFTDAGEIVSSPSPVANYAFPNPGGYKIRTRITDSLNNHQDYSGFVTVMPTAASAQPSPFESIAGTLTSQKVANYIDLNLNGIAKLGGANINWGDGSSSLGTLTLQPNGSYGVYGSHKYATPGNYAVDVTVKDVYGVITPVQRQTIVVRPAVPITPNSFVMTAGSKLSGVVATFTPVTGISPVGAVIDWGDGQASDGTVTANSSGGFNISGEHVYRQGGIFEPTVSLLNPGASVAAGGASTGRFGADSGFTGGTTAYTYDSITIENIVNPAPEQVYKTSRTGDFSYSFAELAAGATYGVRLHFADPFSRAAGQRVFNVSVNGDLVLSNFDIYANTGEFDKAIERTFALQADSSGMIKIEFKSVTGDAMVSGIEVLPAIASATSSASVTDAAIVYTPTSLASVRSTVSGELGSFTVSNIYAQASDFTGAISWGDGMLSPAVFSGSNGVFHVTGSHTYDLGGEYTAKVSMGYVNGFGIDSGSTVSTNFVSDRYYSDGITASSVWTVETAFVQNEAPQTVYKTTRYGKNFSYDIPNLAPGSLYKIRLDFVEAKFSGPGQRLMDVAINGTTVMESYDVFSAAGGKNIALGKTFYFAADAQGRIKIDFTGVQSLAMVSGVQLSLASSGSSPVRAQGNLLVVEPQADAFDTPAGTTMAPVTFDILDEAGIADKYTKVTLTANGPGDFTSDSVTSAFANGGVATFKNLKFTKAGTYTISAKALGAEVGYTRTFTISPLSADHLSLLTGPSRMVAGTAIAPSVSVGVVDRYDNPVGNASITITPTGPAEFAVGSVAVAATNNGVATFDQLYLDKAGSYTLTASSPGLASVTSASFLVIPAAPSKVAFVQQPVSVTAGVGMGSFSAQVTDDFGNLTNYTGTVTASANGTDAFVSGSTTVNGEAGLATFTGLTINKAGVYTVTAAGTGLNSATSTSFTVQPAAAASMSVVSVPLSSRPADTLAPVVVQLLDCFGNVSTSSAAVTIAPITGPGQFTPESSTTVNAVNGVATFSNLVLNKAGKYTFSLSSTGLPGVNLTRFEVIAYDYTVTTLADALVGSGSDITLRQALALANLEGGTPTVSFSPELTGTIYLDPALGALPAISANATIKPSGLLPITISGANSPGSGIFHVAAGSAVVISGLNLTGGTATNGGAIYNEGLLALSSVYITNSTATGFGGAVYNAAGATLTLDSSTLASDSASRGGAIYNAAGANLSLVNVTISGDTATQGGALFNAGTATLTQTTIARNTASIGGGVAETLSATTKLANSIIADNVGGDVIGANPTPYDKATNFDGSNDYVTLQPAGLTNLSGGFTIGVWVYPTVGNFNRILDIGNGANQDSIVIYGNASDGNVGMYVCQANGANYSYVNASKMVEMNKWQFITISVDGSGNVAMYKNGVRMATDTNTLNAMPRNVLRTSNYVGHSNWPNEPYYKGQMNSLSIWNRGLSAAEIATLMTTPPAADAVGLGAFYPMTDAIVPDKVTAPITGTNPTPLPTAMQFDGSSHFIQLPATGMDNFTNGFSFGAWVNPGTNTDGARIFDFGRDSGSDNILLHIMNGNGLRFYSANNSTNGSNYFLKDYGNVLTLNTWQYISVTLSSSGQLKIYKNGTEVVTDTVAASQMPRNIARPLSYLGRGNWNTDPNFVGQMNSASVWNRTLSATEIQSLMTTAPAAGATGLVVYEPMTPVAATPPAGFTNFNGSDNYVQLPGAALSNFTGGFSASVWINPATPANYSRVFDFGRGAAQDNIMMEIKDSGTTVSFYVFNGSTSSSLSFANVMTNNRWQHLAITMDSSGNVVLYRNGLRIGSGTVTQLPANISRSLNYIGKSNWNDPYFAGQMSGFSLWNKALTKAEVQSLESAAPSATASGLVGYWPLNDTGSVARDYSASANNGTYQGGGNTGTVGYVVNASATTAVITSLGGNVIGNPGGGTSATTGYVPSDQLYVNPMLGTLANYGGRTPTMPLLASVPAQTSVSGTAGTVTGLTHAYSGDSTLTDSASTKTASWIGTGRYTPAVVGHGFDFDGSSFVYLPYNIVPFQNSGTDTQPMAVSSWFRTTESGVILGQWNDDSSHYMPLLYVGTDGLVHGTTGWMGPTVAASSVKVNDGKFHHVALSYDGSTQKLWLDGVLIDSRAFTQPGHGLANNLQYALGNGRWSNYAGTTGDWAPFTGQMDEFAIFNRALTNADVQTLMQVGLPVAPAPVAENNPAVGAGVIQTLSTGVTVAYTGDTGALDTIGNNQATWSGTAHYTAGLFGSALDFDGSSFMQLPNNVVAYPNSGTSTQPMAFSTWFRTSSGGTILGQWADSGSRTPALYIGTDGFLYSTAFWGGTTSIVKSALKLNDNHWHHVALSFDGSTEKVYIDGALSDSRTFTQYGYYNGDYKYALGNGNTQDFPAGNGGFYKFTGQLDEFAFFNRPLTAFDIQQLSSGALPVSSMAVGTRIATTDQRGLVQSTARPTAGALASQISVQGSAISLTPNVAFSGTVATFTHANPNVNAAQLSAVVNWGDGSAAVTLSTTASANGSITFANGIYSVVANHTYAGVGNYAMTVSISDGQGSQILVRPTPVNSGMVGGWSGNGNTFDVVTGQPATSSGG
ncbi:MAG: LamG-like jellyroll fold domain-containing protein, partial [Planctomycetota bacterium]